eukprot:11225267-Lingulodinium_polyedra.AAC.1
MPPSGRRGMLLQRPHPATRAALTLAAREVDDAPDGVPEAEGQALRPSGRPEQLTEDGRHGAAPPKDAMAASARPGGR